MWLKSRNCFDRGMSDFRTTMAVSYNNMLSMFDIAFCCIVLVGSL